jgi:hypothetical protein
MLTGGWGAGERSGIHYGWGGSSTPLPINYLLEWNIGENNEEVQEFGLQLGAKDDGNGIGSFDLVLGGGGSGRHQKGMGVISTYI